MIFYDNPGVLTISLHQDHLFPLDSGALDENGSGAGLGYHLNIPLPPGCGQGAYLYAFDQVVLPALRRFAPQLIVLACGFDACAVDPLGRMMLTAQSFRLLTRQLMRAADNLCTGRIVMTHEGGYSEMYVPYCGLAVLEELSGRRTGVEDPWQADASCWGQQGLQPHQRAAIDAAARLLEHLR